MTFNRRRTGSGNDTPDQAASRPRDVASGGDTPGQPAAPSARTVTPLLFDPEWYLRHYEDVAKARLDPVQHYLDHGAREGRNPNALFDTTWYLAANADVRASPLNPFLHFILYGFREGRDPGPPVAAPAASADRVPSGSTTQATIVEAPDETLRRTLLAAMFAAADANEGDARGRTTGGKTTGGNPAAAAPAGLPAKKAGRSRPGTRKTP